MSVLSVYTVHVCTVMSSCLQICPLEGAEVAQLCTPLVRIVASVPTGLNLEWDSIFQQVGQSPDKSMGKEI